MLHIYYDLIGKRLVLNKDDAIAFTMFWMFCNGTPSLVGCWNQICKKFDDNPKLFKRERAKHKKSEIDSKLFVFRLLFNFDKRYQREYYMSVGKDSSYRGPGNSCKNPRFQYDSKKIDMLDSPLPEKIYKRLKEMSTRLAANQENNSLPAPESIHAELYHKLKKDDKIVGLGEVCYNQLWTMLCLTGVFPTEYALFCSMGRSSNPGKTIRRLLRSSDLVLAERGQWKELEDHLVNGGDLQLSRGNSTIASETYELKSCVTKKKRLSSSESSSTKVDPHDFTSARSKKLQRRCVQERANQSYSECDDQHDFPLARSKKLQRRCVQERANQSYSECDDLHEDNADANSDVSADISSIGVEEVICTNQTSLDLKDVSVVVGGSLVTVDGSDDEESLNLELIEGNMSLGKRKESSTKNTTNKNDQYFIGTEEDPNTNGPAITAKLMDHYANQVVSVAISAIERHANIREISRFYVENALCELFRLKELLNLSWHEFDNRLESILPRVSARRSYCIKPDVYYWDNNRGHMQHLFKLDGSDGKIIMRPSTIRNPSTCSVVVPIEYEFEGNEEKVRVIGKDGKDIIAEYYS